MFGACFSIWFVANTISDHNQAMQSLQKGTALVIEGPVDNFTVSASGKAENFTVKGIQFSYSEFSDSEGFHHTSAYGGPMKAGLFIRIHYITLEGDPSEPANIETGSQEIAGRTQERSILGPRPPVGQHAADDR